MRLTGPTQEIRKLADKLLLALIAMQTHRQIEANILGYRLDRIQTDRPDTIHYKVASPDNGTVIARFPDRPLAERFIVMRELRQISMRPRNPVY